MATPETIIFIRHGEKPNNDGPPHGVNEHGQHDAHSLSVRGWTRAGGLAGLFAHAPLDSHSKVVKPARVYATGPSHETKSRREIDTATPTADRLGLKVLQKLTRGEEAALAEQILASDEVPLVVWHHGRLPDLLKQFTVVNASDVPAVWPEQRFDLIWVLQKEPGSEASYRFSIVPQMLLANDQPTT